MNNSSPAYQALGLTADEVLTTTRAVRRRLDLTRPVPRELIQEAVKVATQAPTGRNQQQWDFIFIDDPETKAKAADIWRAGLMTGAPDEHSSAPLPTRMSFASSEWGRIRGSLGHLVQHLHEVPVLMIPVVRVARRAELNSTRGQAHNWGSVIPATWSFMLAARERGLGTAWTVAHLTYGRCRRTAGSCPRCPGRRRSLEGSGNRQGREPCELPRISWSPRSCDQAVCGASSSCAQYACSYSSGGT